MPRISEKRAKELISQIQQHQKAEIRLLQELFNLPADQEQHSSQSGIETDAEGMFYFLDCCVLTCLLGRGSPQRFRIVGEWFVITQGPRAESVQRHITSDIRTGRPRHPNSR